MLVISFNSYKGGACRTTTCYNSLPYLAKKLGATSHQPIIVFDVDLDSMGLTNLLLGEVSGMKYSAKHLFVDDKYGLNDDLTPGIFNSGIDSPDSQWYFENFAKVGEDLGLEDDGSVLFCGADSAEDVISDDQYKKMSASTPLKKLLGVLNSMPKDSKPKAVIFDCAAGVQLSTLNVVTSTDKIVMCMRPTAQFRMGTRDYLLYKLPQKFKSVTEKKREIILLPTSVASVEIPDDDENKQILEKELKKIKNATYNEIERSIVNEVISAKDNGRLFYDLNTKMFDLTNDIIGIPEIQRFKWTEAELLYKILQRENGVAKQEKLLESRYKLLADILAEEM